MTSHTQSAKKKPLLNNTLKLFMLAMVLANISGNMHQAFMPRYLKDLTTSVVQVGLFFTIKNTIAKD